ncbi:RICIN domain-containing protein [Streptomyces cyaneogriseus]|uniref:RICIN domain-containing protein n=1 Tax=Streptomyces cyaneogriseus TaxID=68192 RepID=UPI000699594F|nr:RICIN domain-containing protein [Streptomyces cyaneogriseus]
MRIRSASRRAAAAALLAVAAAGAAPGAAAARPHAPSFAAPGAAAAPRPGAAAVACERQPGSGFAQGQFKGLAEGWSTIRSVGAPSLCLTEGRARNGAYDSAVAVQSPCATATPPRTYLQSAGNGLYRIQWHHPEFGVGCLTVMNGGPVPGMLEPWDDCSRATQFHVEPVDSPVAGGYRFRVSGSSLCIGIVNGETVAGAEAVQTVCAGRADQEFFVDPVV